jgi:hypothetical protein
MARSSTALHARAGGNVPTRRRSDGAIAARPSRKFSVRSNREVAAIAITTPRKEKAAPVGGAAFCSGDELNLTEPLRGFCPCFGLAEGQVVIASHRQLVPIIGATPFCDTGFDSDSAGLVCEGQHGHSPILWKFTLAI